MEKIDPKLWQLIDAHAAGELPPDPENPDFLVHVYVAVQNEDFSALTAAGYELTSELGGTAIVTLPIPQIESLADLAAVTAIFAPRAGQPLQGPPVAHTIEQQSIRLQEAYGVKSRNRPNGSRGEDVIIGIFDSGVNILHDAFTFETMENGKKVRKTRIIAYWVQGPPRSAGATRLWERSGKVFSESDINKLIAAFAANGKLPPAGLMDDRGHGTGVASVAGGSAFTAGAGAGQARTGIAPSARFIVVSGQVDQQAGIEFCFEKAAAIPQPCVVNLSLVDHTEPHNGLSLFARRLRALLTQGSPPRFRSGRAVVVAAGNEGVNHNHMRLSLTQVKTIEVHVDPREISLGCLISSTKPGLKVSLAPPARRPVFTQAGPLRDRVPISRHVVSIKTLPSVQQLNPDDLPSDTDSHILVDAERDVAATLQLFIRPGAWQLKLDPGADPHPEVHIWSYWGFTLDTQKLDDPDFEFGWAMEDEASAMERRWWRRKEWIHSTLRAEASTREAITVGSAMWASAGKVMTPHRPSGRGPATEAGRPAADLKPDLVAPGSDIEVARWQRPRRAGDASSLSRTADGTSYAAPAVAGAVALMLSHDPSLHQEDIRTILRTSTTPWVPWVHQIVFGRQQIDEQNIAGKGLLNIEAALNRVKTRLGP